MRWCSEKGIECEKATEHGYCGQSACSKSFNNTITLKAAPPPTYSVPCILCGNAVPFLPNEIPVKICDSCKSLWKTLKEKT